MKKIFRIIFKSCKKDIIESMEVVQVGEKLPFNEMGCRQNPALYIHPKNN